MDRKQLQAYGWNTFFEEQFKTNEFYNSFPARVIAQKGDIYTLLAEKGNYSSKVTGKFCYTVKQIKEYPVVGDFVVAGQANGSNEVVIHRVLKRKNYFSRKMPISGGRKLNNGVIDGGITEEQVIASNIDTVFVMCGLDGNFNISRLERYLTLARHQDLNVVVLLNKLDLCQNIEEYFVLLKGITKDIPVLAISATVKKGLKEIEKYILKGKTIAFIGSSGVGKSTLLNALLDRNVAATNITSDYSGKGKHTTTHRQIFFHQSGCMIIDTPGLKELQLWADEKDIDSVFQDIADIINRCKFTNCSHKNEPGCAVKLALESGALEEERYLRYLKALREVRCLEEKKKKYDQKMMKRDKSNK
jgi:ribosome biogenesis GTPase